MLEQDVLRIGGAALRGEEEVGGLPPARLAFFCTPLSTVLGVSIGMERECQQDDSLADG